MNYINAPNKARYQKFSTKSYNNGGTLWIDKKNSILLKMCFGIEYKRLEEFQKFGITKGVTYPNKIYKSQNIQYSSAYEMEYFPTALTLDKIKFGNLSEMKKKKIIYEFFTILKKLHQYLILGDIHLGNLMINNTHAVICDWDNYRKLDEPLPIYSPYYIGKMNQDRQTRYTDTVKLVISMLSFYLNKDYERYTREKGFLSSFQFIGENYPTLEPVLDCLLEEYYQDIEESRLNPLDFIEKLPPFEPPTIRQRKL